MTWLTGTKPLVPDPQQRQHRRWFPSSGTHNLPSSGWYKGVSVSGSSKLNETNTRYRYLPCLRCSFETFPTCSLARRSSRPPPVRLEQEIDGMTSKRSKEGEGHEGRCRTRVEGGWDHRFRKVSPRLSFFLHTLRPSSINDASPPTASAVR